MVIFVLSLCTSLDNNFQFKIRLTLVMVADFVGCWLVEILCKTFFADLAPKKLVTKGRERRELRRQEQERTEFEIALQEAKKTQ
jgi:cation-transporting ATPase 13A1